MAWLLIIVMVQWSCAEKTCLNITDTTDVENAVLQVINLGAMFIRSFVIFVNLRCGQLDRNLSETHFLGGFLMLTGLYDTEALG